MAVYASQPPTQRLVKLLARALDPAALDGEAETSAVMAIRHARKESMTIASFAEAIAPNRRLPEPEEMPPAACIVRMRCGKHKGRTLEQIASDDLSYIRWLAEEYSDRDIRRAAQIVLDWMTGEGA